MRCSANLTARLEQRDQRSRINESLNCSEAPLLEASLWVRERDGLLLQGLAIANSASGSRGARQPAPTACLDHSDQHVVRQAHARSLPPPTLATSSTRAARRAARVRTARPSLRRRCRERGLQAASAPELLPMPKPTRTMPMKNEGPARRWRRRSPRPRNLGHAIGLCGRSLGARISRSSSRTGSLRLQGIDPRL